MTFRAFTLVLLGLLVAPFIAEAQIAGNVPRLGVLMFTETTEVFRNAFRQGLRDQGYVEAQNIHIEWRSAGGQRDRASSLAAELARMKVDIIVATLSPAVAAAKNATGTIPIVMAPGGDPVEQGFVASLARPGGNVTGVTGLAAGLSAKRLQLLKEIIPTLDRVAVLLDTEPFAKRFLHENQTAAKNAGIELHAEVVRRNEPFETAFGSIAKDRPAAVIVQPGLVVSAAAASQIGRLALRHRLPSVSSSGDFADAGGFLSYGASFPDMYRRAAVFVDKILKGAKPADLPVEQPTTFELVVNVKIATALGLTIPPSILLRADRVIE